MLRYFIKMTLIICGILISNGFRSATRRTFTRISARATQPGGLESGVFTSISLYRFTHIPDSHLDKLIDSAKDSLQKLNVKGTLLLTTEGYNGQFAIPYGTMEAFRTGLRNADEQLFSEFQLTHGETVEYGSSNIVFPFKRLVVRRKKAALTDGISNKDVPAIDWAQAGNELQPHLWHAALEAHKRINAQDLSRSAAACADVSSASDPIVPAVILDCRNDYESDMGMFQGALPLNTRTFRDTWDKLEELLKDTPKDAPVLTYCTGGIRCVKVNAYLQQKLGFTNTHRLEGGIIAYEQWLKNSTSELQSTDGAAAAAPVDAPSNYGVPAEPAQNTTQVQKPENLFLGKNFLFDRRRLSDDL